MLQIVLDIFLLLHCKREVSALMAVGGIHKKKAFFQWEFWIWDGKISTILLADLVWICAF